MKNLEARRNVLVVTSIIALFMMLTDPALYFTPLLKLLPVVLIPIGGVRFIYLVWKRRVTAEIVSWIIWTIISIAILISIWDTPNTILLISAIIASITPPTVVVVALWKKKYVAWEGKKNWQKGMDILCIILGIGSIIVSTVIGGKFLLWSLILAIVADGIAILPTFRFVLNNPDKDRPFMWITFSVGYAINLIVAESYTYDVIMLPIAMVVIPAVVWIPLALFRIKLRVPLRYWI